MKNQLLASLLGLLLLCLPVGETAAQGTLIDVVCFETTLGEFCVRLYPEDAPQTVANFLKYVNDGDYNNTFFHRSIPGFVLQGGGFSFDNNVGPVAVPKDPPVVNEFKRSNTRWTLAMAKADGNPNSATSEWFINLADNSGGGAALDTQNGGFTVFGEVLTGFSVIDDIARLPSLNLTNIIGPTFSNTPLVDYDSTILSTDFVTIRRAYLTQRDPSAGTVSDPFPSVITTATFSATAFQVPVAWTDGRLYRMFFTTNSTPPAYVFNVETSFIVQLNDKGQDRARFDGNYLTIPSVKIPGGIITNVKFRLTDRRTLEFTLESFGRYTGERPL